MLFASSFISGASDNHWFNNKKKNSKPDNHFWTVIKSFNIKILDDKISRDYEEWALWRCK